MLQEAAAASGEVQVLLWANTELVVEIVKVSGAVPGLFREKFCAAEAVPAWTFPKLKLVGVRETEGVPPVPVIGAVCIPAVSETLIVAVSAPATVGMNFALIVQDVPAASVLGTLHVPVPPKGKSAAFVPAMVMLFSVSDELPVFVRVVVWTALVEPTGMVPKLSVEGVRVAAADPPVPVRGNWCGDPGALSERVRLALRTPVACGVKDKL